MKTTHLFGSSCPLVLLAAAASAQAPTLDVKDGDSIGFASLTSFGAKTVNDSGAWITVVRTDFADPTLDAALLRSDGSVLLREGDIVAGRPIQNFAWQQLLASGKTLVLLDNVQTWRASTLLVDGVVVVDNQMQAYDAAPGERYTNSWTARMNQSGTVLLRTRLTSRECLQVLHLDGAGNVVSATTPLIEGGALAGSVDPILAIADSHRSIDLNVRDEWIAVAHTGIDQIGWFDAGTGHVIVNGAIVASEGMPSPVPGQTYAKLFPGSEVTLNDLGDHAFSATLSGPVASDYMIAVNGAKFVQDGDVLPALAPHALAITAGGPLVLANSSDLFWVATTDDPDASRDGAYMRNLDVIVQEGVTVIGGQLVEQISTTPDAFAASPSGRFWVGEVLLAGGVDAQITVDFGSAVPILGCAPNAGSLALATGPVLAGRTIELALDGAPAVGTVGYVSLSLGSPAATLDGCGITLPFGELLVEPGTLVTRIPAGTYTGAPLQLALAIPNDLALVDLVGYAQGLFVDPGGMLPGPDLTLTNALRLEIGAP